MHDHLIPFEADYIPGDVRMQQLLHQVTWARHVGR